ncbi:hypothetical protein DENSPDRAFT_887158 [Dentipellis sp. KUC8613]|nr:hypothetical protein DENSPDRAFT_887158 [Dentipellis sp. KUC8613]
MCPVPPPSPPAALLLPSCRRYMPLIPLPCAASRLSAVLAAVVHPSRHVVRRNHQPRAAVAATRPHTAASRLKHRAVVARPVLPSCSLHSLAPIVRDYHPRALSLAPATALACRSAFSLQRDPSRAHTSRLPSASTVSLPTFTSNPPVVLPSPLCPRVALAGATRTASRSLLHPDRAHAPHVAPLTQPLVHRAAAPIRCVSPLAVTVSPRSSIRPASPSCCITPARVVSRSSRRLTLAPACQALSARPRVPWCRFCAAAIMCPRVTAPPPPLGRHSAPFATLSPALARPLTKTPRV